MEKLFDNAWFSSIICSIIATIIVAIFSKILGVIRHKKRISDANTLVVNQLRAYVVNAGIPSDTILDALKRSAARKFKIREDEMQEASIYMEELASEIVGNTYLKIDDQSEYLKTIDAYLSSTPASENKADKSPLVFYTRVFFGALCVSLVIVFNFYFEYIETTTLSDMNLIFPIAGIIGIIGIIVGIMSIFFGVVELIKGIIGKRKNSKKDHCI